MKALILVKIASLETRQAYRLLKNLDSVIESYVIYGRYDVALILQAKNLESIRQIIFSEIQPIAGVMDILPCIMAEDETPPVETGIHSSTIERVTT